MIKVLMVCLGNICRSPLAEGILQSKFDRKQVQVDSAGTSNYHVDEKPDPRSIEVALKNGLDINHQRCRQFKVGDFDEYDFIYVMDQSNYDNVIKLSRNEEDRKKVKLILDELYPEEKREVPDPYFGGKRGFDEVYEMLDESTDRIVEKITPLLS